MMATLWRPSRVHPVLAGVLAIGAACLQWCMVAAAAPGHSPQESRDRIVFPWSLPVGLGTASAALTLTAVASWMLWQASATVPAQMQRALVVARVACWASGGALISGPVAAAVQACLSGDPDQIGSGLMTSVVVGLLWGPILSQQTRRIIQLRRRDTLIAQRQRGRQIDEIWQYLHQQHLHQQRHPGPPGQP